MHILIDVSDKEVPRKQDIINISLHFINGEVCECNYPYMVLPKVHGRLIDADDIDNHIIGHVDTRSCPTIIEANKAESEG